MKKAIISEIRNATYSRLIKTESNYYLLEIDHQWLGIIFFPLNWVLPQKVYPITESEFLTPLQKLSRKSLRKGLAIGLGLSIYKISSLVLSDEKILFGYSLFFSIVLSFIGVALLRYLVYRLGKKKVEKLIDISTVKEKIVFLRPSTFNLKVLRVFLFYLLFMLAPLILTTYMLFVTRSLMHLFYFAVCLMVVTLLNGAAFFSGEYRLVDKSHTDNF